MNAYLVSYDLRKPGRDYEELYKYLKGMPYWGHPLESVWIVESSSSAKEIRDELRARVDDGDGVLVVQSARIAAWRNVNCSDQWLKDHV